MTAAPGPVCGQNFNFNRSCVYSQPRHRSERYSDVLCLACAHQLISALADDLKSAIASLDKDTIHPVIQPHKNQQRASSVGAIQPSMELFMTSPQKSKSDRPN